MMEKFPLGIQSFADRFVTMQLKRHDADYNPEAKFSKSEILNDIALAEEAMKEYRAVPAKHRRAFCIFLLLNLRPENKPVVTGQYKPLSSSELAADKPASFPRSRAVR